MENNAQKCAVKCKSDPRPDPTRPDPQMDPIEFDKRRPFNVSQESKQMGVF